jgi:hypothetical protein
MLAALEHAPFPFATLAEALGLVAEPGRHPAFDAMFIYHQQAVPVPQLEGAQVELHAPDSYTCRFDLDVEVWTDAAGVHGFIEYDADLFSPARAAGFARRWEHCALACALEPGLTLGALRARLGAPPDHTTSVLAASAALSDDF